MSDQEPVTAVPSAHRVVRPWARFWARTIDVALAYLAFWARTSLVSPYLWSDTQTSRLGLLLNMGVLLGWACVEPFILSNWATTPGKWAMSISLRYGGATELHLEHYLRRSFMVWWRGLGAGVPVVVLITGILAYQALSSQGSTTWDRDGGFQI